MKIRTLNLIPELVQMYHDKVNCSVIRLMIHYIRITLVLLKINNIYRQIHIATDLKCDIYALALFVFTYRITLKQCYSNADIYLKTFNNKEIYNVDRSQN